MKKIILFVLVAFVANSLHAQDFITVWNLNNPGSSPTLLTFGVGTTGTVNYTWETIPAGTTGSGTFSGTIAAITGLPTNSMIRLKINPTHLNRVNMNNFGSKYRIVDIEQWGGIAWASMQSAFQGCDSLNISASDVPNLSLVTNMSSMFYGCSSLNSPANMNTWNTSNVTNMQYMFGYAYAFNQPIGNWNTIKVIDMSGMFVHAYAFNQSIGNWNTSNVTNMSAMCMKASNFNQPIGNWNTSNVTNMSGMLDSCGMDCTNYSSTLYGWRYNINTPNFRTIGAIGMKYGTNAVSSRNYLINNKGWTIIGDAISNTTCYPTNTSSIYTQNSITTSPNPTHSIFKIECPKNGANVILYNSFGQKLLTSKIENQTSLIDISQYPKGIYIAEIIDNKTSYRVKIIKD